MDVLTVTVADADLVASATLVATTWNVPVVNVAVYKPVEVTVPPPASITLHVTSGMGTPLTVALNCFEPEGRTVAVGGLTLTETEFTVTVAVALLVVSATLVAITWNVPGAAGAVYRPVWSTVPPALSFTLQVTALPQPP
jgi:hypothetical protein